MAREKRKASFGAGEVLGASFGLMASDGIALLTLALVVYTPLMLAVAVFITGFADFSTQQATQETVANHGILMLIVALLNSAAAAVLSGAVIFGVVNRMRGKPVAVGDCIRVGLGRLWRVLALSIAYGLIVGLGFVACIAPGIYLLVTYLLVIPVAVIEDRGFSDCFTRAKALMEGERVPTVLSLLVLWIASGVLGGVLANVTSGTEIGTGFLWINFVTTFGPNVIFGIWQAVMTALIYYKIRQARENLDLDTLAAVFE